MAAAVVTDLIFGKIYNEWILFSLTAGLSYAVWQGGTEALLRAVVAMTIPVIILYPLFMIGGLGAGDIKLLAVTGCFLTIRETIVCLILSFLAGAVLSLLKILKERNFMQRMGYFLSYAHDVLRSGNFKLYEQEIADSKRKKEGKIHFALPILIGVALFKGGIYWQKKF